MDAAASGAGLAVLHGRVFRLAVFAVGHRGDDLDVQTGFLHDLGLFHRPVPAVRQVLGDHRGDLAQVELHSGNLGHVVFGRHLFNCLYYAEYYS